ncbi:D-tagatose-1,6-bisphosphate aldolase subunit [Wolffia australiana]
MADASSLCFVFSIPSLIPQARSQDSMRVYSLHSSSSSSSSSKRRRPVFRCRAKDRGDGNVYGGDDVHGFYPWDPRNSPGGAEEIQWVVEDRITLFTSEGLIHIGGSLVPRRTQSNRNQQRKAIQRIQRFQESDYMDPKQGLCLGALFDIAATNGLDTGRRLCIFGFCRSIEMLSDVVEEAVVGHGGEVVVAEKASEGGLNERLSMIVAVPLLWGVPPAYETLHFAVKSGGGIVEKVYRQWDFM